MTQNPNNKAANFLANLYSAIRALIAPINRNRLQDDPTIFNKKTWYFVCDPAEGILVGGSKGYIGIRIPWSVRGEELEAVLRYFLAAMNLGVYLMYATPQNNSCLRIHTKVLLVFEAREAEYAALGYQPLPPNVFDSPWGWNALVLNAEPICKRVEEPVTYAAAIREAYALHIDEAQCSSE